MFLSKSKGTALRIASNTFSINFLIYRFIVCLNSISFTLYLMSNVFPKILIFQFFENSIFVQINRDNLVNHFPKIFTQSTFILLERQSLTFQQRAMYVLQTKMRKILKPSGYISFRSKHFTIFFALGQGFFGHGQLGIHTIFVKINYSANP